MLEQVAVTRLIKSCLLFTFLTYHCLVRGLVTQYDAIILSHVITNVIRAKIEFSAGRMEGEFSLKHILGHRCPELNQLHGKGGS